MRVILKILFLIVIGTMISGCAVGNKHRYHDTIARLDASAALVIAVGTHDTRPYIVSGDKKSDFVGLSRGGYGNTFDVTTVSGEALATDMSLTIKNSFLKKGYRAQIIELNPQDNQDEAVRKLGIKGVTRIVYLKLNNWKSDTYTNTALIYDVELSVFDGSGKLLARKVIEGRDNLKGSFMNPPAYAKKVVPITFRQKLEILLNSEDIVNALR